MTDQQIENMANKIGEVAPNLVAVFLRNPDGFDYSLLEGETDFTDKYRGVSEFIGDKNKALQDLYVSQDGKTPTLARIASFREKHPDISEEEIRNWFDKTNQYKDEYTAQREYETAKQERAKEVKDLPWYKDMFVSDYSKQRYIDDPSTSILGGSKFSPLSTEVQREVRDVMLGALAGASDFVPGVGGVVVGPLIRGGRDVLHRDENYRPDGSILKNVLKDAAVNAGVEYLPTAVIRKVNRAMGKMPILENVLNARALEKETNDIRKSIQMFESLPTDTPSNLFTTVRKMPDSEMKTKLLSEIGEDWAEKGIDKKKLADIVNSYAMATTPNVPESIRIVADEGYTVKVPEGSEHAMPWLNRAAAQKPLTRVERILKGGIDLGSVVAPGAVKTASRPEEEIKRDETEFNESVDRIIADYSILWSKKSKPQGYDTPLIKAAYDKWLKEQDK